MTAFETALLKVLERIAVALEPSTEVAETPSCEHPAELRIDFGGPEWECRCGYQSPARVAALVEG